MGDHHGARRESRVQHPQGAGGAVTHLAPGPALPFRIDEVASLASTQRLVKARIAAGQPVHGVVVRAREQTDAVGRYGRRFSAELGGSYQSVALRHDAVEEALTRGVAPAVAIGIGIAATLGRYGAAVGLKWPNDLVYLERKLGGILCERVRGHLVVGVGVNVENPVPEGAIALRGWDVDGVSMAVLEGIQTGLALMLQAEGLSEAYAGYDRLVGRALVVGSASGETWTGVGAGVDAVGRLQVATKQGVVTVESGTVRVGPVAV